MIQALWQQHPQKSAKTKQGPVPMTPLTPVRTAQLLKISWARISSGVGSLNWAPSPVSATARAGAPSSGDCDAIPTSTVVRST
jgi:hypothetical protein